jgi:hypothetical protein
MHVSLEAISPVQTGSQGQVIVLDEFWRCGETKQKGNILSLIAFL